MIYNREVLFINHGDEEYDPIKGEMVEATGLVTARLGNLTDMGVDRSSKVFGEYRRGRKVLRLQQPYTEPFDYIRIDKKTYSYTADRLDSTVFYIEEDGKSGN